MYMSTLLLSSDTREEGIRSHYSCELPCGCWDLNSGSLTEQSVLLTTEPSLQPLTLFEEWFISPQASPQQSCDPMISFSETHRGPTTVWTAGFPAPASMGEHLTLLLPACAFRFTHLFIILILTPHARHYRFYSNMTGIISTVVELAKL